MKTILSFLRLSALSLVLATAAQAYTFYFNASSGIERNSTFDIYTGSHVGAFGVASPALSAKVTIVGGLAETEVVVDTFAAPPGTYYIGTVPGGEDIYVDFM